MKCCGEDRITPYCPSCGKQLMKHSPLVSILHDERKRLRDTEEYLIKAREAKYNSNAIREANETIARYKARVEALEEAMSNLCKPAKVMSDWLKDNNYEEAGKALLGAFTGVPS